MKKFNFIYAFAAAVLMLCSCSNDYPVFNDADAFVAFNSKTAFVAENEGELQIAVTLTSLQGLERDVEIEIIDTISAKEGVHFTVEGSKTLHFTKQDPTQYITVKVVDDDVFGGNVKFIINLKEGNVNLGASSSCTVTIEDDEHPLKFILADYTGSVVDYWGTPYTIDWTIQRDDDDLSKVWIRRFAPKYGPSGTFDDVYGIVNDEHTTITIPAGQQLMKTSTYDIKLWVAAEDDPEAEGDIFDSGVDLIIDILEDGNKLQTRNAWFAYDENNGAFEGYKAFMTATKK